MSPVYHEALSKQYCDITDYIHISFIRRTITSPLKSAAISAFILTTFNPSPYWVLYDILSMSAVGAGEFVELTLQKM